MRIFVNEFSGHAFQIELSRELARRGHTVLHVYFADNDSTPKGNIDSGNDTFTIEGLHIPIKFSKLSLRTRRKADIAYGNAATARMKQFRPDIVISSNMPLDAQKILQQAARNENAKFVFWLQDVYSYAVRFVLKKRLGPLANLAAAHYERLEKKLLRQSDGVVCIAPGFQQIVLNWGVDPARAFTIENWAPLGEVLPTEKQNEWAEEQGVAQKFCFMYSGTLGMKHRPELLLALAEYLEKRGDAHLVVIAAGAGADWLHENAHKVSRDTLKLLPFQPYKRISEVFGASDVLIALLDSEAGAFAVPSKVLSYLCAGRPLMLAAPGENHAAAVVKKAQAGVVISPDDLESIVNSAQNLMDNADLRTHYAANARAYAERSFNIAHITDEFMKVVSASYNNSVSELSQ